MKSFNILQRESIGLSGGNNMERNRIFRLFESQILRFKEKMAMEIQAEKL